MPQSKRDRMLNPCGVEVRSTLEGHPAGGRADYHDLGVFWVQNPVLELIALSGRSISRQNALASSRRQVNYATDWPVSCIIQLVGWGVAFLWPGPSTRDPPGQPPGAHQARQQRRKARTARRGLGDRVGDRASAGGTARARAFRAATTQSGPKRRRAARPMW